MLIITKLNCNDTVILKMMNIYMRVYEHMYKNSNSLIYGGPQYCQRLTSPECLL